jgi:hypothetical protein
MKTWLGKCKECGHVEERYSNSSPYCEECRSIHSFKEIEEGGPDDDQPEPPKAA